MSDRGYVDHLHEQLDRWEAVVERTRGTRGWDIDVWCDRVTAAARAVLDRPDLGRDPAALARVSHLLMHELPEALAREGQPTEADPVRRRLALATALAGAEGRLRQEL